MYTSAHQWIKEIDLSFANQMYFLMTVNTHYMKIPHMLHCHVTFVQPNLRMTKVILRNQWTDSAGQSLGVFTVYKVFAVTPSDWPALSVHWFRKVTLSPKVGLHKVFQFWPVNCKFPSCACTWVHWNAGCNNVRMCQQVHSGWQNSRNYNNLTGFLLLTEKSQPMWQWIPTVLVHTPAWTSTAVIYANYTNTTFSPNQPTQNPEWSNGIT